VQRCDDSAHSRARTRSLSLALSPSCFLLRALSLPPSSPLSLNSRTHRHLFLLALLSLSHSPSPSFSLFHSLSLSLVLSLTLSLSLSLSHALFLSSPKLPSTYPLDFKAGWGEEEGEGAGTTRGSIAAARPFGKIFCGGVGAPHRYIYKGMYRNLAHTAHTHLRTHPLTHTRRNCTISRTNSHYDDRVYL
jgi:hypothetical protein